jgi:opacity protein-like surface antigen
MRVRRCMTLLLLTLVAPLTLPLTVGAQTPANNAPLSVSLPRSFQVTVGFAHAGWSDAALSGANGISVTASRHFAGPVQVTFDFASLSGNTLSGSGVEAARHYLVNAVVAVAPRLTADGHLVQPEVGVGIGALASAPAADSSSTRSQNTWEIVAGVDVGVGGPFTLGLAYRHVSVRLQDVATPGPTIPSKPVSTHILEARVGVRF